MQIRKLGGTLADAKPRQEPPGLGPISDLLFEQCGDR